MFDFKSLPEFSKLFPDEQACITFLEKERWGDHVVSPFDPESKVYKCKGVTDTKGKTLLPLIYNTVHPNSTIYSDEWYAYNGINKEKFDHQKVYHKKGAYVIGRRSTNTIEGYWSHLKKMISGTHFWVSRKHLQRYVDCESFRYNTKHLLESERFDVFLQNTKRRLRYSQLKKITA